MTPAQVTRAADIIWSALSPEVRARLLRALWRDVRERRFERPGERTKQ